MSKERRQHRRKKMLRVCSIESQAGGWTCKGHLMNISESGAGLDVLGECSPREEIRVNMLDESGREFNREGIVVWAKKRQFPDAGAYIGLQFT
jgi:hypothetical protein